MEQVAKFKIWDGEEMIDCPTLLELVSNSFHDFGILRYKNGKIIEPIFLQFTGLTDSKGKEIYQGDIIKGNLPKHIQWGNSNYDIQEVKMAPEGYWKPFNDNTDFEGTKWSDEMESYEVIGNIYQHPH